MPSFRFVLNKQKENIIPSIDIPCYTCNLSNNKYCGACKISTCHAHLSESKHDSGCLYLFYENKKAEFDKYDIMYALGIKDKAYRASYNEGYKYTTSIATLFQLLSFLREKNKKCQCPNCGIFIEDNEICIGSEECNKRMQIMQNLFATSNLSYPELRAHVKDIYLILHYKKGVENYLKELKSLVKPNLCSLLGLSDSIIESLLKIPTQKHKGYKHDNVRP